MSDSKQQARGATSAVRVSKKQVIIYALTDPLTGEVRYVGKTVAALQRRVQRHEGAIRAGERSHLYNWWMRLLADGMPAPVPHVIETVAPGGDWVEREQYWISHYRSLGYPLANMCEGGQGTIGLVFSKEHRERLRASHLGQKFSPERKEQYAKISQAAWDRKPGSRWKEDTLEKVLATKALRRAAGLYKKRRPATAETKAKISAAKTGVKLTAEHRAKLSVVNTGKWVGRKMSAEANRRNGDARRGKPLSAEHRAAQSRAHQARLARLKAAAQS